MQTINYVTGSAVGNYDSHTIGKCISAIKRLNYNLTEGELVQIANLRPTSDVEYYLVYSIISTATISFPSPVDNSNSHC